MTLLSIRCPLFLGIVALLGSVQTAPAQTLTERLLAEDPADLAVAAKQQGDIVRGAILYHQGSTNCAKCHRATSERERFGPNLALLNREAPDRSIVEAILQPSKEIREGFETILVTTVDGLTHSGLVVEKDHQQIVIRDRSEADRLITLPLPEVDELKMGRLSSMPEGLADQLKNRQQFLDLVRYVIEIKRRGPDGPNLLQAADQPRRLAAELQGLVLINEKHCLACHSSQALAPNLKPRQAPDLAWSARWLNPHYINDYLLDPQGIKPGTTMPQTLGHLPLAGRRDAARALTHYLVSTGERSESHSPADRDAVIRGRELFHAVGCVACHAPRNDSGRELQLHPSTPLGDLSRKYSIPALVAFLEDPLAARPSGRMPKMQLTHGEAVAIASYLLQQSSLPQPTWQVDAALTHKGQALFFDLGCQLCHVDPGGEKATDAQERSLRGPALRELRPLRGCLAVESGEPTDTQRHPTFQLTADERSLLQAALRNDPQPLTSQQQIDVSLTAFQCLACHDRNRLGGVSPSRNHHFQTTNLNLGDQGRIPPTLTDVGSKLRVSWMRDVLVNGRTVRPYMKTHMPQFGAENVEHLVALLESNDELPPVAFAEFDDQKTMRETGLQLAGNQGLNCVACHTYKFQLADTMPAVDLTEMSDRLKKGWFYRYMLEPQRLSPNTVMPSFWPGGQAIREDLPGDASLQIEALWQYLIDGRQAAAPRGVVREPLEMVVGEETRLLRRSYPSIGKRGIGVGYPGGVNLAFDAEQMRLGLIWHGKFIDPAAVWRGQGSGRVQPLGPTITFAQGPDLDDRLNPWVPDDGRPPQHQFQGYSLDSNQGPTFRYRFQDHSVEDGFTPFLDEATQTIQLRRRLSCTPSNDPRPLRFRVAVDAASIVQDGNEFRIGNRLTIRVVSGQPAEITRQDDVHQLHVEWNMAVSQPEPLIVEYIWK